MKKPLPPIDISHIPEMVAICKRLREEKRLGIIISETGKKLVYLTPLPLLGKNGEVIKNPSVKMFDHFITTHKKNALKIVLINQSKQ